MSKMWEIDPETRSKLLEISKTNENNRCVDCGAPSPQWASPKFGIFFCLACSGIHRSLGVHISFVRSITMDSFKTAEVSRMRLGGNKPWKDFFNAHPSNKVVGRSFEECTIGERYDGEAAEEWKERLTCKVEGTEYVAGKQKKLKGETEGGRGRTGVTPQASGRNTPVPNANIRSPPPAAQRGASPSQKAQNEAFFSRMGEENASRPDNLLPSQGGKYAGFGSSAPPPPSSSTPSSNNSSMPTTDEFQENPMAALTKGFGWLSTTVTKQAATVNKAYIQPSMKSFADGDFAAQARATALQAGNYVQQGTKNINDSFNKFVDPEYGSNHPAPSAAAASGTNTDTRGRIEPDKRDFWDSFGQAPSGPPKEKKDFWDDFSAVAGESLARTNSKGAAAGKPTSIGTSAMKTTTTTTGGGGGAAAGVKKEEGEGWGDW